MQHIDWSALLLPALPWVEKIVRPVLVYFALLVLFRISGKRELAQSTLFDFLTILLIANVVQNAMIGEDDSIVGALLGTVALLTLSFVLNRLTARSRAIRRLIEGQPTLLVYHGQVLTAHLHRESVALNDLYAGLRDEGIYHLSEVRYALLELDGSISVIRESAADFPPEDVGTVLPSVIKEYAVTHPVQRHRPGGRA
ncbi:MAG: DUF421 domain-containing protein [Fimbriimonadaceae bacterium]|nr:DUF421 domain-containing protein [Fimbriimonadaceae bacterium]